MSERDPRANDVWRKGKEIRRVEQVSNCVWYQRIDEQGNVIGLTRCPWLSQWRKWAKDAEVVKRGGEE